jgi:Uma2 family endonuclease
MNALTTWGPTLPTDAPPPEALYEVIDGKYVELPPMSTQASLVASRLVRRLGIFADEKGLGEVAGETLFGLTPGSRRMRRLDVAFVSYQRWPRGRPFPMTDPWPVVPELAVEVVSPHDLAEDLQRKVKEYLDAGVQLVWLVYPQLAWVVAFTSVRRVRGYGLSDTLDAEPALPGFRLELRDLFDQVVSPEGGESAGPGPAG